MIAFRTHALPRLSPALPRLPLLLAVKPPAEGGGSARRTYHLHRHTRMGQGGEAALLHRDGVDRQARLPRRTKREDHPGGGQIGAHARSALRLAHLSTGVVLSAGREDLSTPARRMGSSTTRAATLPWITRIELENVPARPAGGDETRRAQKGCPSLARTGGPVCTKMRISSRFVIKRLA
ncbi:MAG: hypothetical protein MZV64_17110 [Ignavibacteriales bacterium]|nr:hypothetical protein [Ignavibacteriales bacterium]